MDFPDTPRVVFQNNPLVEVVWQVRFPPILEIASSDPAAFQTRIRGQYPLYESERTAGLPAEFAELIAKLGVSPQVESKAHRFLTEDRARIVSLARDSLGLSEHKYGRWEAMRAESARCLDALEHVYRPAFYTRVGLRYRDVIRRSPLGLADAPWGELLNPWLAGALQADELKAKVQQTRTDLVIELEAPPGSALRLRHGFVTPPDSGGELCYLIDADFYLEAKSGREQVIAVLDRFNRTAGNLFRWAVTDKLQRALQPSRVA